MSDIISIRLSMCPKFCPNRLKTVKKMITVRSLQAKHCIAISWKSIEAPSVVLWLKSLSNSLAMEKLTYANKGKLQSMEAIYPGMIQDI